MFNLYLSTSSYVCHFGHFRTVSCAAVSIIIVMMLYQIQSSLKQIVTVFRLQHLCNQQIWPLRRWRQWAHTFTHRLQPLRIGYHQNRSYCIGEKVDEITKITIIDQPMSIDWWTQQYQRTPVRMRINLIPMKGITHHHCHKLQW